ncbi:carboxypeptidase-like regulatory domain-containing protein [Pedobacter sp. Hv1]|uniref:carboxypeptidase-like regulatory domain-containing protein n=1 Tax=Pedobacter sp. Hv1 TaxID=1740090 RepID=UPI0006D8CA37|nr:carboxypeptidase-like regulatory domain-containing protein [Pedobacter sp. Hv1]KQC02234.1 hypothetical protein AQF98_01265 [Pedobacter sp. Hv1]
MSKLKITVPEPCQKNWNDMQPAKDGRICSFCEREVVDFKSWSTAELIDWFGKTDRKVCGHFNQYQLDAVKKDKTSSNNWALSSKILLTSCLALFAGTQAYASHKIHEERKTVQTKILALELRKDSLMINGKVKDSLSQTNLLGVKVWIKGTAQFAFTDNEGRFKISIQPQQDQQVVLIFSSVGYLTKELIVLPEKIENLNIMLKVDHDAEQHVLGAAVITSYKLPFWKRVARFITNPFKPR